VNPAPEIRGPHAFGSATATFVVVSSMVGGGVLTTSGLTVAEVESNALMLVLWAVGGGIALCGALTLAELSAALPKSGGEYVILAEAYGPLAAFLAGWVSLLLGFAAPIAATAWAAAGYLLSLLALPPGPVTRVVATAAIVALAAVHATGRGRAAWMQGAVTAATILLMGLFVAAGLAVGWGHRAQLADFPRPGRPVALNAMFSLVYIAYAYTGWNGAAYLAGEVADPRRLPRAILMGTALVVGLYLGLNLVYALALPAEEVVALRRRGGDDAVIPIAELAAARLLGPTWAGRVAVASGLVLLASLSALELTGPRIAFAMARAGQLPAVAGRLSGPGRTPAVATALLAAGSLVLLWTGRFEQLIVLSGVGLSLFSLLTIAAVFVLRRSRPDLPRPFLTPLYPALPAAYLAATAALIGAAFLHTPETSILALLTILAGVPVYALGPGRRGRLDAAAGTLDTGENPPDLAPPDPPHEPDPWPQGPE
jgi:basic amino acid/polyamine antiporter, APA family